MESDLLIPRSVIGVVVYAVVLAMVWMIVAVGTQIAVQVVAKKQASRKFSGSIATVAVAIVLVVSFVHKLFS